MNKEEIIRMAREAGMFVTSELKGQTEVLERFAALVAEREREACAKVCDAHTVDDVLAGIDIGQSCAAAIRARSETK